MDIDGVLALINLSKPVIKRESGQDLKEGYNITTTSLTSKTVQATRSLKLLAVWWKRDYTQTQRNP